VSPIHKLLILTSAFLWTTCCFGSGRLERHRARLVGSGGTQYPDLLYWCGNRFPLQH